jgi:hypothetical protein
MSSVWFQLSDIPGSTSTASRVESHDDYVESVGSLRQYTIHTCGFFCSAEGKFRLRNPPSHIQCSSYCLTFRASSTMFGIPLTFHRHLDNTTTSQMSVTVKLQLATFALPRLPNPPGTQVSMMAQRRLHAYKPYQRGETSALHGLQMGLLRSISPQAIIHQISRRCRQYPP